MKRSFVAYASLSMGLVLGTYGARAAIVPDGFAELSRAAVTTTVSPCNLNGWAFYNDNTGAAGTGMFVNGPGAPPLGTGSARLALDGTATDRQLLTTFAYAGTRLDQISRLEYSSYRSSVDAGNLLAISLQFDIDYDLTDGNTAWQGRLVFEPYFTIGSGNIPQNMWQTWTPMAGNWWSTGAPGNTMCPQSSPCSFATVLANWPNAGLRAGVGALHFKAGAPWPNFDGAVDAFTMGVSGNDATWNFELEGTCDDGLFCTVDDSCVAGSCTGGSLRDCSATDTLAVDFENPPYSAGSIHLQDGWSSAGASGSGCALYDHAVASSMGTAGFASQSLRMSNAVTSGCFGDQTFSKSLPNEVGETTATNGGMSGGTRRTHFEAQWSFASTVPGAEQPGLSVVASPDRGDGARMSWVQMLDTPTGLEVNFFDYKDNAPFGSVGNEAQGCAAEDDFFFTTVASGLSRSVPHTIKVVMDTYEGPGNDVVQVYVDGSLMHTGTSWEDYFRWCEVTGVSRTVDSILFRTGGSPAPATMGNGYLIDNLSLRSGFAPGACLVASCDEGSDSCMQQTITACLDGDGCCPAGCDGNSDNDCPPVVVPTVSEWGLAILTLIGLVAGTILFGRKRSIAIG